MARDTNDPQGAAKLAGLTYVNDHEPGLSRQAGRGGRFAYRDAEGRAVRDAATLDRIARIVIPPAWTDVWISPDADGHIQATGRDQRGRKQYRYHPQWAEERDGAKYSSLVAFAENLSKLRRTIDSDLRRHGLPFERVV